MINKPRVLFVAEELAMNGAMMSLIALLNALPKEKYDISLFLFKHGNYLMSNIPDHITILPEMAPYKAHRMSLKESVLNSLKSFRINLLVYRILLSIQRYLRIKYRLWFFLPNIPGLYDVSCCYSDGFAAPLQEHRVRASKKVCWIHFGYSNWQQEPFVYEALKKADACVPVSYDVGRELDLILHYHTKQFVVHNITDSAICSQRALEPCGIPRKEGVFRIVSVGRVTPQKGFDLIPDISKDLVCSMVPFEWIVVGDGEDRETIDSHLREEKLSDYVHFIGSRTNPMPFILSADVFVNPSRFESWGMTVSEALCLGKAVITSDLPVFREQITTGVNGIMSPLDPKAIAKAIITVLSNHEFRHTLEENAKKYPFTRERIVEEFNVMIEGVLR